MGFRRGVVRLGLVHVGHFLKISTWTLLCSVLAAEGALKLHTVTTHRPYRTQGCLQVRRGLQSANIDHISQFL